MKKLILILSLINTLTSCSNTPELETGEIRTLQMLKTAINQSNQPKQFLDSRTLLSRKQIDEAKIPVLFIELESGQNGTLTPYPGQGVGQTWLGADGATITMENGILKASRGMGDDLMGSSSSIPPWSNIKNRKQIYSRELSHINGHNKILKRVFICEIQETGTKEVIEIWNINFEIKTFEENCHNNDLKFTNIFHIDANGIIRRSSQYHSDTIGSIIIERLDR